MKRIHTIPVILIAALVATAALVLHIHRASQDPKKAKWMALCRDLESHDVDLAEKYYALSPEGQAEARKGMAPPSEWKHFECEKNWSDFGAACSNQNEKPVENCVYAKAEDAFHWPASGQ